IQQALTALQTRQQAAQVKQLVDANRQAIESDPRDFVANPNGKITLTEFYDYRCPHCIHAASAVLDIIHTNPNVRVVFKEFPIFGSTSDRAAALAIAVKQKGGDYLSFYHDLMNTPSLDDAAVGRIASAHGVDPAILNDPQFKAQALSQLQAVRQLASTLNIDGTPAFIIGDTIIPGDDITGEHGVLAAIRASGTKG
ncbi:MAG TPA: DsbA family protein, partial [Caulobacteraceae bacterium]|nr:DsbA family protein [Caulobacteraceae bacterium]